MTRVEHATRSSRIGVVVISVALIVLVLAPFWGDRQTLRLLAEMFTFVALASLWNLLAGYAGLVSVGQQAFVGLGGYLLFALAMAPGPIDVTTADSSPYCQRNAVAACAISTSLRQLMVRVAPSSS